MTSLASVSTATSSLRTSSTPSRSSDSRWDLNFQPDARPDLLTHSLSLTRARSFVRRQGDAADVVEQFDPKECRSVFSTTNQGQTSDDWFLQSASNVSCFFEEGVLDEAGDLKVDKAQAINKIGHALHEFRAPFKEFAESDAVKAILVALGYEHPIAVQSMYIMKSARVGGVGVDLDRRALALVPSL